MSEDKPDGCIFCMKIAERRDHENGILFRGRHNFVILNAYPYNPGHLMIVPYEHLQSLQGLRDETAVELIELTRRSIAILTKAMSPEGMNVGVNEGVAAGAGIADHVHQHIVPRWAGDTNFMTTVGHTKVLPELLTETYVKLAPLFGEESDGAG